MPGFLTNIAMRAAGAANPLRPRIPTLFEPAVGPGAASSLDAADAADAGGFAGIADDSLAGSPGTRRVRPLPRGEPLPPIAPPTDARRTASAEPTFAEGGLPSVQPRRRRDADVAPPYDRRIAPESITPRPPRAVRAAGEGPVPAATGEGTVPPPSVPSRRRPETAAVPPSDVENDAAASRPALRPVPAPALLRPALPQPLEKREERDQTGVAASRRDAETPLRPRPDAWALPTMLPEAPTIHVSIGRIEVRAAAAPTPQPPRTAPPSKAQSLDEYLRTRNGRNP